MTHPRWVVEVLYRDRCQRLPSAIERVRQSLVDLAPRDLDIELRLVRIAELDLSPIIRVNGRVVPIDRLSAALGAPDVHVKPRAKAIPLRRA